MHTTASLAHSLACTKVHVLSCRFNSEDNASPLYLTESAEDSHFFKSMPAEVVKNLQRKPLAMENHSNGEHTLILRKWFSCLLLDPTTPHGHVCFDGTEIARLMDKLSVLSQHVCPCGVLGKKRRRLDHLCSTGSFDGRAIAFNTLYTFHL